LTTIRPGSGMFNRYDDNENGLIEFSEFLTLLR
jgi:Ca2+-binding EF-hand superfamily protein